MARSAFPGCEPYHRLANACSEASWIDRGSCGRIANRSWLSSAWAGRLPHFARALVGPSHDTLLPASAVLGALYLLAIDDIARTATAAEIPLGILTALIGAPVFAFLLRRTHLTGWRRD